MTEPQRNTLYRQETGSDVPVSFVVNNIVPRKESMMSKIGYFFAGAVAGAAALIAAAFLIDGIADKSGTGFDSEEDSEEANDAECENNTGAAGVASENVSPASEGKIQTEQTTGMPGEASGSAPA